MVRLQYKRYSLEVELKLLHSPHDCKTLLLDGGVVPLCRRQFLAAVAHRVGLPVVNLHQHCAYSIIRRISPKDESPLGIGQSQDGSPGQQNSHGLERALLGFLPLHCIGLSLLQQVRQWHCYSCEVGDIFPIVVGKSHEGADLFLGGRSGCFHDLPHVVIVQSLHTFTQPMSNEVDVIGPQNTFAGPNWHRGKLPFEIPNFAKFCHKNCQILPQKIAKFATFCHKNCQILQIKFTYRITFFCSRRPGILHSSKDAHKKSLRGISEGRMIKNINLISK